MSAGATILVISGNARPWVSPDAVPVDSPLTFSGVVAGLWVAGGFVLGRFERRSWRRAGRRANLTPEGGGLFGHPDLVGTVGGQSVRVSTEKRREGSDGEGRTNKATYTVETTLATPVENGFFLGHGDDATAVTGVDVPIAGEAVGDVSVVGGPDGSARDVVTGRAQDALRRPTRMDSVVVGDASDVIREAVPDASGTVLGAIGDRVVAKLEDGIVGDSATVATETRGTILDGAELARQVEAVVAVADAYESATVARPEARPAVRREREPARCVSSSRVSSAMGKFG